MAVALEAMVYPQSQDPFGNYGIKDDLYNYNYHNLLTTSGGGNNNYYGDFNFDKELEEQDSFNFLENQTTTENYYPFGYDGGQWNCSAPSSSMLQPHMKNNIIEVHVSNNIPSAITISSNTQNPKRQRAKSRKNKEEMENQRMTHIAVERNRRKQMNEYLSVLRSLMPHSYVQRGDQASILGGAINFVKELEQRLQCLSVPQKQSEGRSMPFSDQFLTENSSVANVGEELMRGVESDDDHIAEDIQVTMVESHANLRIRSKKRPKQLLKMVSSLHGMRLTILHLNVTTNGELVFYSLSVKVEEDCKLGSVDEIAAAVYQMLNRIQQERDAIFE